MTHSKKVKKKFGSVKYFLYVCGQIKNKTIMTKEEIIKQMEEEMPSLKCMVSWLP